MIISKRNAGNRKDSAQHASEAALGREDAGGTSRQSSRSSHGCRQQAATYLQASRVEAEAHPTRRR